MWFGLLLGRGIGSFDSRKETSPGQCRSVEASWIVDDASILHRPRWHLDGLREASVPLMALCGDEEADWSRGLVTELASPDCRTGGKTLRSPRAGLPGYLERSPISNSK